MDGIEKDWTDWTNQKSKSFCLSTYFYLGSFVAAFFTTVDDVFMTVLYLQTWH
jgi:hypothetical protein